MLVHRANGCHSKPRSVTTDHLKRQFAEGVLPHVMLDDGWKRAVTQVLLKGRGQGDNDQQRESIARALENLRKQHPWGDIGDEEYRTERVALERRLRAMASEPADMALPDLERAAALLSDLPALWSHPGVDERQREELARELLERVDVAGGRLVAVTPREVLKPLFAYTLLQDAVRNRPLTPLQEDFRAWDGRRSRAPQAIP
jgi:hypothetical protein